MIESSSFVVLKECFNLSRIVHLSDKSDKYLDLYKVSRWTFAFVFLFPLNLLFIFCMWFCFDYDFNLEKVIWSMNLMAAIVQMEAIYVCLIKKKNLLIQMFDDLHILVNQSMCVK